MSSSEPKFLIGVDGSDDGDAAFDFYVQHLHKPNQQALIVYVVKPLVISSNEMAIYVGEIRERSQTEEKQKVKQLKETYEDKMRNYGVRGKINIIYYSKKPGKILCELAEQEKCSVIVIGCRKPGKASLGPIVDYVLRKAPCYVSLAPLPLLAAELSDSVSKLQEFRVSRSSRESSPRRRRISCPVMRSPPLVPDAEISGGAAVGGLGTLVEAANVQKPKQRRHSTVANVFHHLGLQAATKKKQIPTTDESDETKY